MSNNPKKVGKLMWTGLRQMQSLRDALAWSLGGEAVDETTISEWLQAQGLANMLAESKLSLVGIISAAVDDCRIRLLGDDACRAVRQGQRASHKDADDVGTERSGAGWANAANFCITSAFLRLLGAWEQYELDVLKALVHYRPTAEVLGPPAEQLLIEPDLSAVHEEPTPDNSLFSIHGDSGEEVVENLNRKSVSEDLRRRFANEDVVLSEAPDVSAVNERKNPGDMHDKEQDFSGATLRQRSHLLPRQPSIEEAALPENTAVGVGDHCLFFCLDRRSKDGRKIRHFNSDYHNVAVLSA